MCVDVGGLWADSHNCWLSDVREISGQPPCNLSPLLTENYLDCLNGSFPPLASVWGAQSLLSVSWKAEGWARAYHLVMWARGSEVLPSLVRWATFWEDRQGRPDLRHQCGILTKGRGCLVIKTFQHSLYSMPSRLHFLVYPFKEIVRKEEESVCARGWVAWGWGGG